MRWKRWAAVAALLVVIGFILRQAGVFGPVRTRIARYVRPLPRIITRQPDFELDGEGLNVDSIAFWEAPRPEETLLFVTAKENSLVEVWRFPFVDGEQPPLRHERFGAGQVNGVAVDQGADLLFIAVADPTSAVVVFSLPELALVRTLIDGQVDLGDEPGIALFDRGAGDRRVYVTTDADQSVHIYDAATGVEIGTAAISTELETALVDPFYDVVYIPDETGALGVLAYDPDLSAYTGNGRRRFGGGLFQSDAEGMVMYACQADGRDNGAGFLVLADQRNTATDFEFFDRQNWEYRGTLRLAGVSNTDGLGSIQTPLPGYPLGLFTAINDDRSVVGIGWDVILAAMDLSCGG